MNSEPIHYRQDVNYQMVDPAKRAALAGCLRTLSRPHRNGVVTLQEFLGESCSVGRLPCGGHKSHVVESLGTKDQMALALYAHNGDAGGYMAIAQDGIAMAVNDASTVGIPIDSTQMFLAIGISEWAKSPCRNALMGGWENACIIAETGWTGGETPVLRPNVEENSIVLGASVSGYMRPGFEPWRPNIQAGDIMVGIGSSGVHSNGISAIRRAGAELPLEERLDLFRAALIPTCIYTPLVNEIVYQNKFVPHYCANITGHAAMKFMRAQAEFTYRVKEWMKIQPIFDRIQKARGVDLREMLTDYNMGVGYLFIVSPEDVHHLLELATTLGFTAQVIGEVETGPKRVILEPFGITFEGQELNIR